MRQVQPISITEQLNSVGMNGRVEAQQHNVELFLISFAMHVAKTGLNSQQIKMQVIANNLANVNTTVLKQTEPILSHFSTKSCVVLVKTPQKIQALLQGFRWVQTRLLNTTKLHYREAL